MIRYIIVTIIGLVAIAFIRAVMSVIKTTIMDEVTASVGGRPEASAGEKRKQMLRKCSACGTFKPEMSMISVREGSETSLYCSRECQKQAVS